MPTNLKREDFIGVPTSTLEYLAIRWNQHEPSKDAVALINEEIRRRSTDAEEETTA